VKKWWIPSLLIAVVGVALDPGTSSAQTAYRLKGSVRSEAGKPVPGATIKATATHGFRGDQFVGQKDFAVSGDDKGEWNMLGLTAGVWRFTISAPGMLPSVVVIPIKFSNRQMQSAQSGQLSWALPTSLIPIDEHPTLTQAVPLALEGRAIEALQFLAPAVEPGAKPAMKVAAAEMAILIEQNTLAQQLFAEVGKADPKHGRAALGLASLALLRSDWESAGKLLWVARDLVPRDQRPALASAITELQAIARVQ
jgi:hypothetical protein